MKPGKAQSYRQQARRTLYLGTGLHWASVLLVWLSLAAIIFALFQDWEVPHPFLSGYAWAALGLVVVS